MAKSPIVAAIEEQERLASNGSLQQDRDDALDRYLGRPYGDEVEGRSQIVMRDTSDTLEWIKPALIKTFCSGDEVVKFDPRGPEDEEQAEQETDYCNQIITQKNNGFLIFNDWFHDALLQKNGYVMGQYETEKTADKEQYQGLTDDEFAQLLQDPELEIVEHSQQDTEYGPIHDFVAKRKSEYGCIKVTNIAPERVRIAADYPDLDLQKCPFVRIEDFRTISDLRQEGYDVPDDINDDSGADGDSADQRRSLNFDASRDDLEADPATRRVRVRYVWMRYDQDGDGIAELRRIVLVGTTELENEEDDLIPVASLTPIRMPHEHNGLSYADILTDLQRIRTMLMRGALDNMYLANNGRYAISDKVNLDDMLVARPGGIVRINGDPGGNIMPLVHPQIGSDVLQTVEYIDTIRENRTGITKYNQGMDSDSLNKTAHGMSQVMQAAQQRTEMVARMFAETGVKSLMLIVHALSLKHGRKEELVKLRNKWVPVDPRTWKKRRDLTVSVGLGTGNKDAMLQHLTMILQAQREGLQIGVTSPPKIYNALAKLTQNAGFRNPEEFWDEPKPPDPNHPPPPSPEQQKMQLEHQEGQQKLQLEQQKMQTDVQMQREKLMAEMQMEREKMTMDMQMKQQMAEKDFALRQESHNFDMGQKRATNSAEVAPMLQDITGGFQEALHSLAQLVMQLHQETQSLKQLAGAERQLIRDPKTGRVSGVRVVQ